MNSSLVFDSEDSCKKDSPEEKSANDCCISVAYTDDKTKDSALINTPSSISESGNKFYFSGENVFDKTIDEAIAKYESAYEQNVKKVQYVSVQTTDHSTPSPISESGNKFYFSGENVFDKTIDEAIAKYESAYEQNVKKVQDVSVQTTDHMPRTINKQCQCDLGLSEDSNFTVVVKPSTKKIKLNICRCEYEYGCISHRNVTRNSEPPEQQQDEGNESKYLEKKATASQIKMSGIRVGLSKRVRPPPLHLMN